MLCVLLRVLAVSHTKAVTHNWLQAKAKKDHIIEHFEHM